MTKIPIAILAIILSLTLNAENLLKNSDFQEITSARLPVQWSAHSENQEIMIETKDIPEGCKAALKVEIKNEGKGNGSIVQDVADVPANSQLILTGKIKSTAPGIAYILIKLKEGKKTIKRLRSREASSTEWKDVKMEFSNLTATVISVQLRFRQDEKSKGSSIWFADLKLDIKK